MDAKTAGYSVANLGEKALFLWYFFCFGKKKVHLRIKKIKYKTKKSKVQKWKQKILPAK